VRSLKRVSFFIVLFVAVVTLLAPDTAYAQRGGRGRGGTRAVPAQRVVRVAPVRSTVIVGGYYGRRYYYDPFFYGYYGFSPWFAHPHVFYSGFYGPHYGPYGYYGGGYDYGSSVRLQVTPRHAEVYVNGYLAGTVDDFDGFLQRLRLPPGQHELVLYLDGFQTVRQNLHLPPGATYRVRHAMVSLPAGQAPEPRPIPPPGGGGAPPLRNDPQPAYQRGAPPYPVPRQPPQDPVYGPSGPPQRYEASRFGTLRIRVQPGDAVVLIDGEEWRGPETQDALVVQLSEGTHRIEVRKDGYDSYSTDIRIRQGEATAVNVSLPKQRD
jgi:hypothetical protein